MSLHARMKSVDNEMMWRPDIKANTTRTTPFVEHEDQDDIILWIYYCSD
jgi:hypothetical protein